MSNRSTGKAILTMAVASFCVVSTPVDARKIRHSATTTVSRDKPKPDVPRSSHSLQGNRHPDRVENWSRPNPPPSSRNRSDSRPPPHRGDGGHYYGDGRHYDDDWDRHRDHYRHDRYWRDDDDDDFWEFLGAAAVVTAGIAIIGAATDQAPSETCTERVVDGYTYLECGDRWYVRINENGKLMYQQVRRPY